jgi:beta-barrel assembly-enhancing protease
VEPKARPPVENPMRHRLASVLFLSALVLVAPCQAGAPNPAYNDLPDIGTPADTVLSATDEASIGRMVIKQLRDAGQILENPEVSEYIQSIGDRLASHAQEGTRPFSFFVIKDREIQAFALPGGFVCINAGLILATTSESELAGVMGHEISHVTQRHIARAIHDQMHAGLAATAAMLAAILLGAASRSTDVGMAGVVVGQGAALQHQLNFSRENEYEADRVGIGVMAAAGYDPNAMATFFETIGRRMGSAGPNAKILEFLQTHPVTSGRVAEARARAATYPIVRPVDTVGYTLTRERLRVLLLPENQNPRDIYPDKATSGVDVPDYRQYGRALALVQANAPTEAVPILRDLVERHPDVIEYHTGLGQALLAADDAPASKDVLEKARFLFPRNVPVTVRYAETLLRMGEAKQAHAALLDLFNAVAPTQEQVRLIALAANAAGETAEAYYYIAEGHAMNGELPLAINTLRIALATPAITPMQRSRFKARIDELKEYLPPRAQAAVERGEPAPTTGGPR